MGEIPNGLKTSPATPNGPSRRSSPPRTPRRSRSLTSVSVAYNESDRMKYTRNFKLNKDKGNQTGSIQGPFTTLEEVLKRVPVNVGFNLECKYPMVDECEQEEMDFFNVELNWWVDTGTSLLGGF